MPCYSAGMIKRGLLSPHSPLMRGVISVMALLGICRHWNRAQMANKLSRFVCVCFVSMFIVIPGYEYAYQKAMECDMSILAMLTMLSTLTMLTPQGGMIGWRCSVLELLTCWLVLAFVVISSLFDLKKKSKLGYMRDLILSRHQSWTFLCPLKENIKNKSWKNRDFGWEY